MRLKRRIFLTALRVMERRFLRRTPDTLYCSNLSLDKVDDPESVDVITIAFNNAKVIALHNQYTAKYLTGHITHIVVDNSTDKRQSQAIREVCEASKVPYVRLHRNRMDIFSGSYSHAAALNWSYRHIIMPRQPYGFGFIDHDIFPITPIDIARKLSIQPLYGAQRKRNGMWYLSAIMFFLRYELTDQKQVSFMPMTIDGTYLDTGGSNWSSIYSGLDEQNLHFVSERMESFREGENRHQDQVELFDDDRWVHTINGSYWKKIAVVKEDILEELVRQYERRLSATQKP